jgi:hypothetical protein
VGKCPLYKSKSLFVELPCEAGTPVYVIERCRCAKVENYRLGECHKKKQHNTPEIFEWVMKLEKGRRLARNGFHSEWIETDKAVICYKLRQKSFDLKKLTDFGKTVFLTEEQAKAKLKEVQNGKIE